MNRLLRISWAAIALLLGSPAAATAVFIDFEASAPRVGTHFYFQSGSAEQVVFTSSVANNSLIIDENYMSGGYGLAIVGGLGFLIAEFATPMNYVGFDFGNDVVDLGSIDVVLELYLQSDLVARVTANGNGTREVDQHIGYAGSSFTGLIFNYRTNGSFSYYPERIDNFEYGVRSVPEPSTWLLMILGFGAVGGALRSAKRTALFADASPPTMPSNT